MKKVLVITYYWPPAGGPGVQRVLKFVKYLPLFGWQPMVLTVEKGDYPAWDESLLGEVSDSVPVYRSKILEPYDLYRRFTRKRPDEKIPVAVLAQQEGLSLSERIARFVRANLFIPDGRVGWIPFAVREAIKVIRREGIDVIFTSGPPHTVQLIGMRLKQKTGLPWVADFRDPWTDIDYYADLKRFGLSKRMDAVLERRVLGKVDAVTTIGTSLAEQLKRKQPSAMLEVIQNGFDEEDFKEYVNAKADLFRMAYIGNAGQNRNPEVLFEALSLVLLERSELASHLELLFVGSMDDSIVKSLRTFRLEPYFKHIPYVPHEEAIRYMARSAVLLLIIDRIKNNTGILTGKLFDYLAVGKPILGIGPIDGDAARILQETGHHMVEYEDVQGCQKVLRELYEDWREGIERPPFRIDRGPLWMYTRRYLTQRLAGVLDQVQEAATST